MSKTIGRICNKLPLQPAYHLVTLSSSYLHSRLKFLKTPDKGLGGNGEELGSGTESKWGMDWDMVGGNTENWSNWSNGVNETVLVQILGESFKVDWAESAGSCNKVSGQGGDWASNLGGSHGGGDNSGEDDLKTKKILVNIQLYKTYFMHTVL